MKKFESWIFLIFFSTVFFLSKQPLTQVKKKIKTQIKYSTFKPCQNQIGWGHAEDIRLRNFGQLWNVLLSFNFPLFSFSLNIGRHGLRTPRQSFFSKIRNFWAWADKLGRNFIRYFWPNYKHYIGTVSLLSMGKCSWLSFLQKTLVFRSKTYNSQIFPK